MSFPLSPQNGQLAAVNNITYVYSSSGTGFWTRVYANTSTLIGTQAALTIANTSSSTDAYSGALVVGGGVGVGGSIYFNGNLYQNGKLFTSGSTSTTSTFTILNTTPSVSTNTGALQVVGGVGIGGNLNVGGISTFTNKITANAGIYATQFYDSANGNYYTQPSSISKINALSAIGAESVAFGAGNAGLISVTRYPVTTMTYSYYGMFNQSIQVGMGIDSTDNFWVGRASGGIDGKRTSTYFYADTTGNLFPSNQLRSDTMYGATNTAYYLNVANTVGTILSSGASIDLIGKNAYGAYFGNTDNRYLTNGTTSTNGPLWVATGTVYTILHSGNAAQYTGGGSPTFTGPVSIKFNNSTSTAHLAIENQTGTKSLLKWTFGNTFTKLASVGVNNFGDMSLNSDSGAFSFNSDSGTQGQMSLAFTNTTFLTVNSSGVMTTTKDFYGRRFVDNDDNNYFIDPNGVSNLNTVTVTGALLATYTAGFTSSTNQVIKASPATGAAYIVANRSGAATGEVGYGWGTGSTGAAPAWINYLPTNDQLNLTWSYNGTTVLKLNGSTGVLTVPTAQVLAKSFYDVDNSAYYVDPAGNSYISSLQISGGVTSTPSDTGLRIFSTGSNSALSTLYIANPTNTRAFNWQLDTNGNHTLWGYGASSVWKQALLVDSNGTVAISTSTIPIDVTMTGGLAVNGTGGQQLNVQKNGLAGLSVRVADVYTGDFALYDNQLGSWNRSIHSVQGNVGVKTNATTTMALSVGGDINVIGNIYKSGTLLSFGDTISGVNYTWTGITGTSVTVGLNNTFETAAIVGADHILGSGTMMDLLAFNLPSTYEFFNGTAWVATAPALTAGLNAIFSGQSGNNVVGNYNLNGLFNTGIRFTWPTFGTKSWDAFLLSGNSNGTGLDLTLETGVSGPVTTVLNRVTLGATGGTGGSNYLRTQGTNPSNPWVRISIRVTNPIAATSVNIANISLFGNTGNASRLLTWDYNKNLSTYGDITGGTHYDKDDTAYYLNPNSTSTLYNAVFKNGMTVANGLGRFAGQNNSAYANTNQAVELGVSPDLQSLVISYNRATSAYSTLTLQGSIINIIPQGTTKLNLGGNWYDADNNNYYVKPSLSSVIGSLSAFGIVQFVNTGGTNFTQNLRLPRASDGQSVIALGSTATSNTGSIPGQWNIMTYPLAAGATTGGSLVIKSNNTDVITITSATGATTFVVGPYADKYFQKGGNDSYFLTPSDTSNINGLTVGTNGLTVDGRPVLTNGPLDDYLNTFTYVHTAIGNIDTPKDFNTSTLTYQSIVGSFQANANQPFGATGNNYYGLYQAKHRGGGGADGTLYGSQIVAGWGTNNNRLAFRSVAGTAGSWGSWYEPVVSGLAASYTIKADAYYGPTSTAYFVKPEGTSTVKVVNVETLNAAVTGTPSGTGVLQYLGSAEWLRPDLTTGARTTARDSYRPGLYTWKSSTDTAGPTGATNPYFAGVGFGAGVGGAAELAMYIVPNGTAAAGAYFRTLRDSGLVGWSSWTQLLDSVTHAYAAGMNQAVNTTANVTFNSISLSTAPSFNSVVATSYGVKTGNEASAVFIIPWSGTGYGGFGAHSPTGSLQSFRFDQVAATNTAPQGYVASTTIGLYAGANKFLGDSGDKHYGTTYYDLSSTSYYIKPTARSYITGLTLRDSLILDNAGTSPVTSPNIQLVPGVGLVHPSYNTTPNARIGNVSTYGAGTGISGYSIQEVGFVSDGSAVWGLRGVGGNHWPIKARYGATAAALNCNIILGATDGTAIPTTVYNVQVQGSLYATSNVYAYSDRRKKRDIVTVDNALAKVMQLRGVYYYRIDPSTDSDIDRRDLGVIAQEVVEVLPESVKYAADTDEYSVNYGSMAGVFIEAIKDLKKEVDYLRAELNMLKNK